MGATIARLGLDEAVLGLSQTIARGSQGKGADPVLPNISMELPGAGSGSTQTPSSAGADLVWQGELGRGGMGVIHLARQRSLDRAVAVKAVLASDEASARALVREAQIMGALEHPNLVPVHVLGLDGGGGPLLVMKRIEGASWRALLLDPAHEGWKPLLAGHGDPLRANVEILSQLCRALAFAHDRGVVHRDLKPENVMIGRYGEVYLVDWGVALRLAEREHEAQELVGTPAYLAPEMARADPLLIDARTDVYLLGGVLFEVLTVRVPHEAPTALAALVLALRGEVPAFPAETPTELADLARRAMARDPEDRVAGAEAFREGLAQFLASREVDRAVTEARLALSRARELISNDGPSSLDAFRALVEARITFASAHRARPKDATIRADLDATVTHLVEGKRALRSPVGARTLLGELGTPSPDLQSRVDALDAQLTAERRAAEAHLKARADADLSPGLRVGPLILLSVPLVLAVAWFSWKSTLTASVWVSIAIVVGVLLWVFLQRRVLLASQGLRRYSGFLIIHTVNIIFVPAVMVPLGITSLSDITTVSFASYANMWAVYSLTTRGVWPNVLVYLAATGVALAFPQRAQLLAVPVTTIMIIIWSRAVRVTVARERASDGPPPT
jgi:eukaryotic-like serine/threonine-protein kinase